jgi:hypothetical protein
LKKGAKNGPADSVVYLRDPRRGTFLPGFAGGPGRPRGSRDKLARGLLDALTREFQAHGDAAVERVRREDPVAFLHLVFRVAGPTLAKLQSETSGGPGGLLTRMGVDEVIALRRALEAAVAAARAGLPVQVPEMLEAQDGDGADQGEG